MNDENLIAELDQMRKDLAQYMAREKTLDARLEKLERMSHHSLGVIARLEYKVKAQAELLERAKEYVWRYSDLEDGHERAEKLLSDLAKLQSEEAGEKT